MVSSFVLAIAAACASAGCGVQPPKQTTFTFSYDVISERPATTPIDAPSIVDLETPKVALAIIDDKGFRSGGVTMRTTPTTEHGAQFMVSEDDRRVEFVRRNDDGSIALTALIERPDNALTLFEPPLIVAPATLEPGASFTSESAMRVVAIDDPSRQREHGPCKHTVTYANDATVRLAAGEVDVARLEVRFEADLRLANAEESTTMYVSRGETPGAQGEQLKGLILKHSSEKITILGAFPRTTRRTLLRETWTP